MAYTRISPGIYKDMATGHVIRSQSDPNRSQPGYGGQATGGPSRMAPQQPSLQPAQPQMVHPVGAAPQPGVAPQAQGAPLQNAGLPGQIAGENLSGQDIAQRSLQNLLQRDGEVNMRYDQPMFQQLPMAPNAGGMRRAPLPQSAKGGALLKLGSK